MQLIIQPTGVCNFNCKFCSAGDNHFQHPADGHVPDKIKDFIRTLKPNNIIITGGDPLCVSPDYYRELREVHLEATNNPNVCVSITSNLKDFYLHPDKWKDLLQEPWILVSTSFQYGTGRMWDKNTVYTEEMFKRVMDKYGTYFPDKGLPSFIATIDYNNEHMAIDHVYLAMELGTRVKLNNVEEAGNQHHSYPRHRLYRIYLDIIDQGLDRYEITCAERNTGSCSRNTHLMCESTIRCCNIDTDGNFNVSICDSLESMGYHLPEDRWVLPNKPVPIPNDEYLTQECMYCNLCKLCNGCRINRCYVANKDPNYCSEMKKLEERLVKTNWHL